MKTKTNLAIIQQFLTSMSEGAPDWHLYSRLLQNGQSFTPAASIPKELVRGAQGFCFANCQVALAEVENVHPGRYRYAEGYAIAADAIAVPIHHAWLVDPQNRAVDCTWKLVSSSAYFGFTFETQHVLAGPNRKIGEPLFQDRDVLGAYFTHPRRRRPSASSLITELVQLQTRDQPETLMEASK